jgi:2-polyprenyl-6-hydroxyphenyl methylase/3-demethylubiquinone-9 3-methyltransferase
MPVDNQLYDRLAETWWQPGGALGGLDTLNPGRFAYLNGVLGTLGLRYDDLEVLDLGCGGGLMSEAYARHGARVTGVDPSSVSLAVARSHARESRLSIRYEQGRGEAIPLPDASFDLVSCCDVLEHVDDLDAVIRQIARVLRPGGLFFFDTINRTWLSWLFVIEVFQEWLHLVPPGTHDWDMFITPGELGVSLARAGLELCDLTGLGPSLDPLGLGRALLRRATGRMDHDDALALVGPTPFQSLLYMGWATTARVKRTKAPSAREWRGRTGQGAIAPSLLLVLTSRLVSW